MTAALLVISNMVLLLMVVPRAHGGILLIATVVAVASGAIVQRWRHGLARSPRARLDPIVALVSVVAFDAVVLLALA